MDQSGGFRLDRTNLDLVRLPLNGGLPFLQNLRVRNAGVGHVTVDPTPPGPARSGSGSPCYGLVVADPLAAERDVVHAALREKRREEAELRRAHEADSPGKLRTPRTPGR